MVPVGGLGGALNAQANNNTPHKRALRSLVGALRFAHLEPASASAWLNWVGWYGHWVMHPLEVFCHGTQDRDSGAWLIA